MTVDRPSPPLPPLSESQDAGSLGLRILAHRAELLSTLTPGLMHHLSNAGQGLVAAQSSPDAIAQVAARLEKARRVIGSLVSELALGAVIDSGEASTSIDEVLEEVESWQGCQITLPRVRVVFDPHPPLPRGRIRSDHLRDALAGVVTNAKEAMAATPTGTIHVTAEASAGWVVITVMDEGPGIDLTTLARLFEPYNSTKQGGGHMGLGLCVARDILTRVGGDLRVAVSDEQPHTSVRLWVPANPPSAAAGPGRAAAKAAEAAGRAPSDAPGGCAGIRAAA